VPPAAGGRGEKEEKRKGRRGKGGREREEDEKSERRRTWEGGAGKRIGRKREGESGPCSDDKTRERSGHLLQTRNVAALGGPAMCRLGGPTLMIDSHASTMLDRAICVRVSFFSQWAASHTLPRAPFLARTYSE
jgi:hypothetical protein